MLCLVHSLQNSVYFIYVKCCAKYIPTGNIVLHIFYGEAREYYDIESLWTLGPECDPKCQTSSIDPYALSPG